MFTGIVTDIGSIAEMTYHQGGAHAVMKTALPLESLTLGASIACAGVCLTVVDYDVALGQFAVDISAETLSKTTLQGWKTGQAVNLERALKVGDELGGHIVSGHVDAVAQIVAMEEEGESTRLTFAVPGALGCYIASKGSVTLDGCSLTVNEVEDVSELNDAKTHFGVNLIPHTKAQTTFGSVRLGDKVNIEIDVLARYVARLKQAQF